MATKLNKSARLEDEGGAAGGDHALRVLGESVAQIELASRDRRRAWKGGGQSSGNAQRNGIKGDGTVERNGLQFGSLSSYSEGAL